jgi:DNA-binding PadR family transcriptional regulator
MALSLKYVVLGMVVERPGYGYELQARIDDRLPFLDYTPGAVYPALDRLERDRLIEATGPKASLSTMRGSPRVVYAATAGGVEKFERWMYTPSKPEASRDILLAKLPLARPQDLPRLLDMARNQEAHLRRQLGGLREAPASAWTGSGRVPLTIVGAALVRSAEARRLSAAIESLQEIRQALEHELRGAPSPRATGVQPPLS